MTVKGKNLNIAFPDFNFVALQYLNKILKPPQSRALTFRYRVPILYYCFHQRHAKRKAMKCFIHITNGNQHWIQNGFGFSKKKKILKMVHFYRIVAQSSRFLLIIMKQRDGHKDSAVLIVY